MASSRAPGATLTSGQRRFVAAVSLALLAWLVYLNSLTNPFVFDDHRLILENRSLEELTSLRAILWSDVTRPVVNLSYALDLTVWGPGPFGLHVTNVLLHALTVALVFVVGRVLALDSTAGRTTAQGSSPEWRAAVVAATAALLFAVHPLLSQAVGYVAGRSELLCVPLLLLAFLCGRRVLHGGGTRWRWAMVALWGGALASKEVAAMLPFLLLAYDRLLLRAGGAVDARGRLLRFHVPLIGITAALALARMWMLATLEYPGEERFERATLLLVAVDSIRRYLGLLIMPSGQTIFHALPPIPGPLHPRGLLAIGSLAALLLGAWRLRRLERLVAFGICWFVLLLAPSAVLFVFGRGEALAEHRVYGASVGMFLIAGASASVLLDRTRALHRPVRLLVYGVLVVFVLQLAARTVVRNAIWSDPVMLWRESVSRAPDHWLPRLVLAEALREREGCAAAEAEYRRAIEYAPREPFPRQKLGACLIDMQRLDEAAGVFTSLRDLAPSSGEGSTGLGMVAMLAGRSEEARSHLEDAVRRDAQAVLARQLLARMEEPVRPEEALRLCREIQLIAPGTPGNDDCIRRNQARIAAPATD